MLARAPDVELRWPGPPDRRASAALLGRIRSSDSRFLRPHQTFGLELRLAHAVRPATPDARPLGFAQKLSAFDLRPASEPIIFGRWADLKAWRVGPGLCDDLAACLSGGKNPRRTGPGRSLPGPTGARTLFPPPEDAAHLWEALEDLSRASLDPLTFAMAVYAAVLVHHPYGDGNGRLARALFQGALSATGHLTTPSLPLGPMSYVSGGELINALHALGRDGNWLPVLVVLEIMIQRTVDLLDGDGVA